MAKKINTETSSLKLGDDYYIENGNYVFTESFLKKRGYCCESHCRHCPYGFAIRAKLYNNKKNESR